MSNETMSRRWQYAALALETAALFIIWAGLTRLLQLVAWIIWGG